MLSNTENIPLVRSNSLSSDFEYFNLTHKYRSRSLTNISHSQHEISSNAYSVNVAATDDNEENYSIRSIGNSGKSSENSCEHKSIHKSNTSSIKSKINQVVSFSVDSDSHLITSYNVDSIRDQHPSCLDNNSDETNNRLTAIYNPNRKFYCREWLWEKLMKYLTNNQEFTPEEYNREYTCTNNENCRELACKLVICGESGSGKTSICRKIIQTKIDIFKLSKMNDNKIIHDFNPMFNTCEHVASRMLAYHLCDARSKKSLQPELFINSLRNQLLSNENPIFRAFKNALHNNNIGCGKLIDKTSPSDSFYYEIIQPLRNINISHLPNCSYANQSSAVSGYNSPRFFILVDGLDEIYTALAKFKVTSDKALFTNSSNEHDANRVPDGSILEILANHAHLLPDWLILVITCRRKYRSIIKHMFPGIKTIAIDDLRKPMVAQDVQNYMINRFSDESILCPNEVREDIIHLLRIKCSACMLYLETVLDWIRDEKITLQDIAFIPGTLNGLFLWLCQSIFPVNINGCQNKSSFATIKPLLNIILASCEPLSINSLYSILIVSNPNLKKFIYYHQIEQLKPILSLCCGLSSKYITNKENDTFSFQNSAVVQFFHEIFAEWLIDVKHCTSNYLCNIMDGQMLIEKAMSINNFNFVDDNIQFDISLFDSFNNNSKTAKNQLMPLEEYLLACKSNDNDNNNNSGDYDICKTNFLMKRSKSVDKSNLDLNYLPNILDCATISSDCHPLLDSKHQDQLVTVGNNNHDSETTRYVYSVYSQKQQQADGDLYNLTESMEYKKFPGDKPSTICNELISTIRLGQYENVKSLLESEVNPNTIDQDGWSALRTAAWGGYSDIVKLLIYYGADVNLSGPDGRTALRAAAWAGNLETVKCLLDAGADVNKSDSEKRTALIAAAYMGHTDVLAVLLKAGADVNHSDSDGRTALHVAAFCVQKSTGYSDIVACLLDHGANPNLSDSEGITPLLGASNSGNYSVCELCLESDADVNMADKSGRTPVMLSVLGGHTDIVRLLLFWGAAVDIMDYAGRSLLSIAAQIKNAQIVQELLARGLDEAHKDHSGCTPLHLAVENLITGEFATENLDNRDECCEEVVRLLLDAGANLEETDNAGRTPLLVACQANNMKAVQILLNYPTNDPSTCRSPTHSGSSESRQQLNQTPSHLHVSHLVHPYINIASYDGQTPLRAAAFHNNHDMVKFLLSFGADPDHQDAYGRTALYMLALEGQLDMADLLLHCPAPGASSRPGSSRLIGANPVLSDDEGRFPLHVVTWLGNVNFVRILLQAGTPVDIRDREGRTPLQLAAWQGHAEICHILLNEGNARVDVVCSQGATALCIAAQEGHLDVCKVLLNANANPSQTDSHGRTPYRVALKAGHLEICKLLELCHSNFNMVSSHWTNNSNHELYQHKQIIKDLKNRRDSDKVAQLSTILQQKYSIESEQIPSDSLEKMDSNEIHRLRNQTLNQSVSSHQPMNLSKLYYEDDDPYARPPELFTVRFVPSKTNVGSGGQFQTSSLRDNLHMSEVKGNCSQDVNLKSGYSVDQSHHQVEKKWNNQNYYYPQPSSTQINHIPASCSSNSGYPLQMVYLSETVNFVQYNPMMFQALAYCQKDYHPIKNQSTSHPSIIVPTNRKPNLSIVKSEVPVTQVPKYALQKTTQVDDKQFNCNRNNKYLLNSQKNIQFLSNEYKQVQNTDKEAFVKHKKLLPSKLECFGGPSSSRGRQINQRNNNITNSSDNSDELYTEDCKGMFFKSAGVFGLGSKKHKKSTKLSSGKHESPVLGSSAI
ncbi:putative ank repeat-containing [Schistosoma mansoni]|uniref:putative ank repeat-containing n=1 Tax=Schistosoma mansoni TaxID=6183 RepID=UPI00022DC13A|nr:putative ank repeat-containing [Schistosoma mansoni]|eukprot:XP_018648209.1 putative ank repeat-containing [Schistosoma mansoni]